MTNLSKALEIVKVSSDRKSAIEAIVKELGVTKSNAHVYVTKANKLLGSTEKNSEKNTEKTDVKTQDLTEKATKSVKKSAKTSKNLESVDTMIANLKANGGNTVFGVI